MEEPAQVRPAGDMDLPNGAMVEVVTPVVEVQEEEEPPRSATAKQEEAKAALGAEGSRPFTIRELLGELKEDGEVAAGSGGSVRSSFGERNGMGSAGAEGSSYSAIERNHDDPDAYYNWALVLQESADNVDPNSSSSKDALLEEACKKYAEATRLCPTLYDAYYNWAIAIADRAKMRGRTKEAEELWKQYGLAEDTMRYGRPNVSPNELYNSTVAPSLTRIHNSSPNTAPVLPPLHLFISPTDGRRDASRLASAASGPARRRPPPPIPHPASGLPPPASRLPPPTSRSQRTRTTDTSRSHARGDRWHRGGDSSELGQPPRPRAPALPPGRPANPAGGTPVGRSRSALVA
ncbi:hypothetical protein GUJ93_ZPchr0006g41778 [Zizania palustris]|uniref:Uncharacterized protein n=1 Tax=Zizania palustris TaxID=103762 RepID=A0A8J5SR94_ZIZPA|nr:hypothetical protein GUJ93_ZPchr0006g41778 [Zizania palustris]